MGYLVYNKTVIATQLPKEGGDTMGESSARELVQRIKRCMEEQRMNQAALARGSGISKSSVSRYVSENPETIRYPHIETLRSIAKTRSVSVELLTGEDTNKQDIDADILRFFERDWHKLGDRDKFLLRSVVQFLSEKLRDSDSAQQT